MYQRFSGARGGVVLLSSATSKTVRKVVLRSEVGVVDAPGIDGTIAAS